MKSSQLFSLEGKNILVTGGAGLIGKEICQTFIEHGASIAITDIIEKEDLDELASTLNTRNTESRIICINADITDYNSVNNLFTKFKDRFNKLDVLVNLAAIDAKIEKNKWDQKYRFDNYPIALWEQSLKVNCTGMFLLTQQAIRLMLKQGKGNIIHVASGYSTIAPNQALYNDSEKPDEIIHKPIDYIASKSMVPNFTRYIASTYGKNNIRCNAVMPHGVYDGHSEKFRKNFANFSPLGRMSDKKELRGPFVFLASDASSYITGTILDVTGGWTAW